MRALLLAALRHLREWHLLVAVTVASGSGVTQGHGAAAVVIAAYGMSNGETGAEQQDACDDCATNGEDAARGAPAPHRGRRCDWLGRDGLWVGSRGGGRLGGL
jgi:hypothetical protein